MKNGDLGSNFSFWNSISGQSAEILAVSRQISTYIQAKSPMRLSSFTVHWYRQLWFLTPFNSLLYRPEPCPGRYISPSKETFRRTDEVFHRWLWHHHSLSLNSENYFPGPEQPYPWFHERIRRKNTILRFKSCL